jgi:hypothetical protein
MNKIMVLLIIIGLSLLLWWFWPDNQGEPERPDQPAVVDRSAVNPTEPANPAKSLPATKQPEPVEQPDTSETRLPFHTDPLVDLVIGMNQYSLCLIREEESGLRQLEQLGQAQQDYLQPHLDACDEKASDYQQYRQEHVMKRVSQAINQYGQDHVYLHSFKNRFSTLNDNQKQQAYTAIRNMGGNELLVAVGLLSGYFDQELLPRLQTTLGGQHQQMTKLVLQQAVYVIACQRGADCSATSGIMLGRCMNHEYACGLDFNTFINSHYMPGMMNEINQAVVLLKQHFQWL